VKLPVIKFFCFLRVIVEMATFAGMTILLTYFPNADEDILESVLDGFDGNVEKAKNFIEKSGAAKMDSSTKKAMKPKKNVATKKTVNQSAGMLSLQKEFPHLEVDTIKATLMAFDDDLKKVHLSFKISFHRF
jgi:hypothetical protein